MANVELSDGTEDDINLALEEAAAFCAEAHVEHIRSMFQFYEISVLSWAVCQVADNCNVNNKVAKHLQLPHVACKSYLLNLEVNYMVRMTSDLENNLASVHDTMTQCKQRLRNAALLPNVIDLRPVLHNQTKLSGKLYMFEHFLRSRDEIIEVSQYDRSQLVVNSRQAFKGKVQRNWKQLWQIDFTTK